MLIHLHVLAVTPNSPFQKAISRSSFLPTFQRYTAPTPPHAETFIPFHIDVCILCVSPAQQNFLRS